ncbi:MAG: PKD domain-containing protein, partial [candidate division WOR-3 bacterium]|nr:PKD domain-containing protein [candidate division WOR-3 bacterium]
MGTFRVKFGVILAIVAMVIVSSACGPSTQPPPSGNQPPVISSLTAAETDVYPLSTVAIQCAASDPDGDPISYAWSTTGGSLTGTGSTVSWVAPEYYGDYDVTVTVEDDQGNSTVRSISLNVVANR